MTRIEGENEKNKTEVKRLQDACDEMSIKFADATGERDRLEKSEKVWQRTKRDLEEVIGKLKENVIKRDEQVERLLAERDDAERRIEDAISVLGNVRRRRTVQAAQ